MARRIYSESIKVWALKAGIPLSAGIIFLTFFYLSSMGLVDITGMSNDMVCADTCYLYLNFTPKEDLFIYPTDYDPYGRNTPVQFDPAVKSWTLDRSWGDGWRNLPMDRGCTGTWCGGKPGLTTNKFSVAFREDKEYQIRIKVEKKALQTIKWWSNDWKIEDPLMKGVELLVNKSICTEYKEYITKQPDGFESKYNALNDSSSMVPKYKEVIIKRCVEEKDFFQLGESAIEVDSLNMGANRLDGVTIVDDVFDGDGDGICEAGESCCNVTDVVACYGHNSEWMVKRLSEAGIE